MSSSSAVFVFVGDGGGGLFEESFVGIGNRDIRAFQLLKHVFNVVGRHDIVRQFAIEIVERQVLLVAAQFEQSLHYVVAIFVFDTTHFIAPKLLYLIREAASA